MDSVSEQDAGPVVLDMAAAIVREQAFLSEIDGKIGELRVRGRTYKAGEIITVDGSKGEILAGAVKMIEPELTGDFATEQQFIRHDADKVVHVLWPNA